ncbi:MAG TPA: hypothetical protein VFQ84_08625 [Arenimonas sp.]|uniref:hypothetical protein n=1 Tax=Arenimonas sp. TaxID=1872635 RepID=UPI002D7E527C|nr:hypothetical protein [Arenimonas sp.]HEU0153393.1 hypothetical protein [Arenimonas sp.]
MNQDKASLLLKLVGLALAAAIAVGLQARERASGGADLYGYALVDSELGPTCPYDYVDLGEDAEVLALQPGHPAAASDDLAAVLPLARPFEFYQLSNDALVVSSNGYLAAAGSLAEDDGADFSNDCRLPARADNGAAVQDRVYVYHDDLRAQPGGTIRQAYFPACPRASASGDAEPCTVVEWNRFERATALRSTQPLRAQAVLYHDSHAIALQYASIDDSRGAQATIGLQGLDGRTARLAGCDLPDQVKPRQALCFFDPRNRPAGARRSPPRVAAP